MSITLESNQPPEPNHTISGAWRGSLLDFNLGTYATGGVAIFPDQVGLSRIDGCMILGVKNVTSAPYVIQWDYDDQKMIVCYAPGFTPAGTNSAPAFTGSALAAHRHVLHFQTSAAANAVTAAANSLRTAAAAFDVAGVANSSGEGGVVDASAGTPAGTVAAPTFTGTAVAAGVFVEVANGVDLSAVIVRALFVGN